MAYKMALHHSSDEFMRWLNLLRVLSQMNQAALSGGKSRKGTSAWGGGGGGGNPRFPTPLYETLLPLVVVQWHKNSGLMGAAVL